MDWSFNWTAQGVSFRRGEMRFRVSLKEEASVDAKDQRVGAKAIPKLMLVSDLDNTMILAGGSFGQISHRSSPIQ